MSDLLVIVPSRGRPESVPRMVRAWRSTGAYEHARLVYVIDADDPKHGDYFAQDLPAPGHTLVEFVTVEEWLPMVHKLNRAALVAAGSGYFALGFAGDDHLPRSADWARAYLEALREMGTGIVYGDDGLQGANLPTQWAMTSDIVRALGRMVPAPVEHLYCDNAVKDLGEAAGCLRYLPDVLVEHMHPIVRKAKVDDGYRLVNAPSQYRKDRGAYQRWRDERLPDDAATVRALQGGRNG